jgi:hypothetical protein
MTMLILKNRKITKQSHTLRYKQRERKAEYSSRTRYFDRRRRLDAIGRLMVVGVSLFLKGRGWWKPQ